MSEIENQIRRAVLESGLTRTEVAQRAGMKLPNLSRFLTDGGGQGRSMSADGLEALARALGGQIVFKPAGRKSIKT